MLLKEAFAQQVLCDQQAVFAAGTEVGQWREVLLERLASTLNGFGIERRADQRTLAGHCAFRNGRHAAEGDAGIVDQAVFELQVEGRTDGRDVIVETLGDLVGAEHPVRLARGTMIFSMNSPCSRAVTL